MATSFTFSSLFLLLILLYSLATTIASNLELELELEPDPYFSQATLFSDHINMLSNLKIFIYPPPQNYNITLPAPETFPPPLSLFYTSLLNSPFLTRDPTQAILFFFPFSPQSTRSLSRHIQYIRTKYPFWNRSLGADHFFLTRHGVGSPSTRNVVELLKNAVWVTCFPSPARDFVPHKDVTLPPYFPTHALPLAQRDSVIPTYFLGYWTSDQVQSTTAGLINRLKNDEDFLIQSDPTQDEMAHVESMERSKFCLFNYDVEGMVRLGMALTQGCVPVVITERTIQDFPLMDVIRWSEIALFVRSNVGADALKSLLKGTLEEGGRYEMMRRLGVVAAQHMRWNRESVPLDAFEMVVYQLWLRRHAIRYSQWEGGASPGVEAASK